MSDQEHHIFGDVLKVLTLPSVSCFCKILLLFLILDLIVYKYVIIEVITPSAFERRDLLLLFNGLRFLVSFVRFVHSFLFFDLFSRRISLFYWRFILAKYTLLFMAVQ